MNNQKSTSARSATSVTADEIITWTCKENTDLLGLEYSGALVKYLSPETKCKIESIKTEDGGRPYRAFAHIFHEALMSNKAADIDKTVSAILKDQNLFINYMKMAENDLK